MTLQTLFNGKAHKFEDDVTTDYIIAGKFRGKAENIQGLLPYLFCEIRPGFIEKVQPGDVLVAGENFGTGSSREHAASLVKASGIGVVLAKSFARIFYRNAINIGMPVIECDTGGTSDGDEVEVDLAKGTVVNKTTGKSIEFRPIPDALKEILEAGGLVPYLKKLQ